MAPNTSVGNSAKNLGNTAKNLFTETSKQTGVIILVSIVLLVLLIVVIYIISIVKKSQQAKTNIQSTPIALDNKQLVPITVDASKLTSISKGQEFSLSFWIYLSDSFDATSNYKLVLQRGNSSAVYGTFDNLTNPLVFIDKNTNRLFIALSTNNVQSSLLTFDDIMSKSADGSYNSGFLIGYVDYVSLQRWVNIILVVNDSSLMIFLDGDLYSIVSVADLVTDDSQARPIINGSKGDLVIGDNKNPVKGYLSNVEFYGYAVGQNDIKTIYKNGPTTSSFLSLLGLGRYGVRNPVYSLDG